jgi:excinuclease UvrABC nuclease subunit
MAHWKSWIVLLIAACMVLSVGGCRKDEKEEPSKQVSAKEKANVRAKNACEQTVREYLGAAAAKDFRRAVDYIDVEEMVEKGREKAATSTATPPEDADRMKDKLVAMLEKALADAGELTCNVLGSKVSGNKATVEVEIYRDGKKVDQVDYPLTKRDDLWKISGSPIQGLVSARRPNVPGPPQ